MLLGVICFTYASIKLFPSLLFANNLEYKSFTLYYHSSEIIEEKLKLVLDKSQNLINNTELYKAGINQDIFICSSYNEFTFFALLSRNTFGINNPISQNIFLSKSFVLENYILRNGKKITKGH